MNVPALARLPSVAPDEAAARNALLAGLRRLLVAGTGVRVAAGEADAEKATGWVDFGAAGVVMAQLAPLVVAGRPTSLAGEAGGIDAVPAMSALDGLEPLLDALEARLGFALAPIGLSAAPCARWPVARLDLEGDDGAHAVLLATAATPRPPPDEPSADTVLAFVLALDGPRLPLSRARRAAAGDLLLLGLPPLAGSAGPPGARKAWRGVFDPASRAFRILQRGDLPVATHPTVDPLPADEPPPLTLPIVIRIDGGELPVAQAAALAPGATLTVLGEGPALPVTLDLGGAAWARGELVALGEGYGVLLTGLLARAG